jgi:hypothetical protein
MRQSYYQAQPAHTTIPNFPRESKLIGHRIVFVRAFLSSLRPILVFSGRRNFFGGSAGLETFRLDSRRAGDLFRDLKIILGEKLFAGNF